MLFSQSILASSNIWYDKYVANENIYGSSYYTSKDSSDLAWGESYLLRSYIELYNQTKDNQWLQKFTLHVDKMISNSNDDDNDGYLGWTTYKYSPIELDNGGFELDLNNWTRFQSTTSTAFQNNEPAVYNQSQYGEHSLTLKTNGSSWQKVYQKMMSYEPNTKYRLRLFGKTNGLVMGEAYVHDRTTNTILGKATIDSTEWGFYNIDFTTPSSGHNLEIWLGHNTYTVSNGITYFDQVEVSAYYPYHVHDAMIGIPIAEFIRLINNTPELQLIYQNKANSYRQFVENELIPKWEHSQVIGNTWDSILGTYRESKNYTAQSGTTNGPGTTLPYNMFLAFSQLLIIMYDINGNSSYLEKAKRINEYFKTKLVVDPNHDSYLWKYSDNYNSWEDTSHGQLDLSAIVEMYRYGLSYSGDDIEKFANTFSNVMVDRTVTPNKVKNFVSGNNTTRGPFIYTLNLANWTELSQFDKSVWPVAAEQYRSITPNSGFKFLTLAQIMKWDRAKLVNRGFEYTTSFDNTQPAQWVRTNSTAATAYMDTQNKISGNYGATIKSNGTSWQYLTQTWEEWVPSTSYTLTFSGKTDTTGAGGRVIIKNETTGESLVNYTFENTSWQSHSVTFNSPSNSSHVVRVYLGNKSYAILNGKVHFDNIKIKAQSDVW